MDLTVGGIQHTPQKRRRSVLLLSFHTFRRVVYATIGFTLARIPADSFLETHHLAESFAVVKDHSHCEAIVTGSPGKGSYP